LFVGMGGGGGVGGGGGKSKKKGRGQTNPTTCGKKNVGNLNKEGQKHFTLLRGRMETSGIGGKKGFRRVN